ncbi:chromosome partitioning protein ParA [Fulvimarina sp. 2208YS6-2-32]|uniref:Chromosome partitioning protein ParA n=1 Tax=Fulvimarina uroteuthidis TaxID=3098149 RepID=A0ABU5I337_9HYPH|nr:chromosome partitioning protein ParA [Fulvimarina sp. 2208YS6-2-32]MDY8108591.1 chromosome partitioning protein ParA [Fulvimarina sp. 2208YS6-2-32]
MIRSIGIGTFKSSGTTILALTAASAAACSEGRVVLVDAAHDPDLALWARKGFGTPDIDVIRAERAAGLPGILNDASNRGHLVVVDAGRDPATIARVAALCDRLVIPVRLSPASALAVIATERHLDECGGRAADRHRRILVANAITPIPSRVARAVEAIVASSATRRLEVGLGLRAAYEAPFLGGGTLFDLMDEDAPGLVRARAEAMALAVALGLSDRRYREAAPVRAAEPALRRAVPSADDRPIVRGLGSDRGGAGARSTASG